MNLFEVLREVLLYKIKTRDNTDLIWSPFNPYDYIEKDLLTKIAATNSGLFALSEVLQKMFENSFLFNDINNIINFKEPYVYGSLEGLDYVLGDSYNFSNMMLEPSEKNGFSKFDENDFTGDVSELGLVYDDYWSQPLAKNAFDHIDKLVSQRIIVRYQSLFNMDVRGPYDNKVDHNLSFISSLGWRIVRNYMFSATNWLKEVPL